MVVFLSTVSHLLSLSPSPIKWKSKGTWYLLLEYNFLTDSELFDVVLQPSWVLVDPICTFLFSVLVLITTFAIIKDTMLVLMEGKH
jgi:hypothetical protein